MGALSKHRDLAMRTSERNVLSTERNLLPSSGICTQRTAEIMCGSYCARAPKHRMPRCAGSAQLYICIHLTVFTLLFA